MQKAKIILEFTSEQFGSLEVEAFAEELLLEAREHLLTNNGETITLHAIEHQECEKK